MGPWKDLVLQMHKEDANARKATLELSATSVTQGIMDSPSASVSCILVFYLLVIVLSSCNLITLSYIGYPNYDIPLPDGKPGTLNCINTSWLSHLNLLLIPLLLITRPFE